MYYVYVLKCSDSLFYTGITWGLHKRMKEHKEGTGTLFTRSRLPVKLVYFERVKSKREAARREKIIKDMSQNKKRKLIRKFTSSISEKRV